MDQLMHALFEVELDAERLLCAKRQARVVLVNLPSLACVSPDIPWCTCESGGIPSVRADVLGLRRGFSARGCTLCGVGLKAVRGTQVIECDLARNKNREALAALRRQGRWGLAAWGLGGSFGNHQQGFVVRPGGLFVRMTVDRATTAFLAGALQIGGTLRDGRGSLFGRCEKLTVA